MSKKLQKFLNSTNSVVDHNAVVYKTTIYDKFEYLPGNRYGCEIGSNVARALNLCDTDNSREFVKRRSVWMKVFKDYEGMDKYNPIKVAWVLFNGVPKLTILDGQGRTGAIISANLNYPLFYEIIYLNDKEVSTIAEAQEYTQMVNLQSDPWTSANKRDHMRVSDNTDVDLKNQFLFQLFITQFFNLKQESLVDNIWSKNQGSTKKEFYHLSTLKKRDMWKSTNYENEILRISNNDNDSNIDFDDVCDTPEKRTLYSFFKFKEILYLKLDDFYKNTLKKQSKSLSNGYMSVIKSSKVFALELQRMVFRYEDFSNGKLSNEEHDFLLKWILEDIVRGYDPTKKSRLEIRKMLYNIIKPIVKEKKQPGINMQNIKEYVEWFELQLESNTLKCNLVSNEESVFDNTNL
jgi:hypothetical protein